jgi:hypothetical protein
MVNRLITRFTSAWIITAAFIALSGWASTAAARIAIPAVWDENTFTEGQLGNSSVNMSNVFDPGLVDLDLSGPDFVAAPLSSDQTVFNYETRSNWTATFDPPVENLLLYVKFWRGTAGGADPVTYQFDQPFVVLSGLGGTSVSNGNTLLSVPGGIFSDGILQFAGPVSSLSVQTNSDSASFQELTFGVIPSAERMNIPTLSEWGMITMSAVLGIIGFMAVRRRQAAV